ncbi:MAG TPA: cytochrome b N-terminal domain-containing protein [Acidobacteriota bacterium]|nr:cytochrome b N-terminal domain-containing protein [Acidobacteriota bacterium]
MSVFRRGTDWLEQRLNLSEIFSFLTSFGISYTPLDTNVPLRQSVKETFLRPIPSYERWPHVLGILTFITFLLEVLTGFLLAFYFQPTTATAYDTTQLILRDAAFGWYIHQMHYWGGQLLAILLLLRLVRFFWHRVYKRPHELTWIFGTILFLLAAQSSFTGRLLPWDQVGYWGTVRGLELFEEIPVFGALMRYLVGGFTLADPQLIRFYLLHVMILPLLTFAFFYLHFATVRKVGLSTTFSIEQKTAPIYPRYLMNLLIIMLVLFGLILTLAVLVPDAFSAKADPFRTPAGISVSWYLLPLYGLFELAPRWAAAWIALLATLTAVFLPLVDRVTPLGRSSRLSSVLGILIIVILLILSYYGYRVRG